MGTNRITTALAIGALSGVCLAFVLSGYTFFKERKDTAEIQKCSHKGGEANLYVRLSDNHYSLKECVYAR